MSASGDALLMDGNGMPCTVDVCIFFEGIEQDNYALKMLTSSKGMIDGESLLRVCNRRDLKTDR